MPSWSIHLKIGKKLNEKLKLDDDSFLFGSLLPDVDSNWGKRRFETHYYGKKTFPKCPKESMIDIETFLYDYKDKLTNPLIIGYYTHLLTDNYYNEYVYYNKWIQDEFNNVIGIKRNDGGVINVYNDFEKQLKYKHTDLELYGKKIFQNKDLIIPKNIDSILKSIDLLKDKFVTKDNVIYRINYLNNEFVDFNKIDEDKEYELFNEKELDDLLNNCIKYILKELKKVGVYER